MSGRGSETGRIVKATSGFYYVQCGGERVTCRARGLFRRQGITPLVGDRVEIVRTAQGDGTVIALCPRVNALWRPPVANVDRLLLVLSVTDPPPNLLVVDRLLAIAQHKDMDAAIIVTKTDLAGDAADALRQLYAAAGYEAICVNAKASEVEGVRALLADRVCVLTGNSGAGKSTLLNALCPSLGLETGETSRKLGRGRHTTRVVELFELCGGLVADTPGFSALEAQPGGERIKKEELAGCFREFAPYRDHCRFTGCSHTKETGCAVIEAEQAGLIARSRRRSYLELYEEAKAIKDWED